MKFIFKVLNKIKAYRKRKKYYYRLKEIRSMKINIIADKQAGWILYKFGKCVYDELCALGVEAKLSNAYDPDYDINHYFLPNEVGVNKNTKVNEHTSFMITHVDSKYKLDQIKELTDKGATGVCMSLDTLNRLSAYGIARDKICYINPAQDGQIQPKKITLGFTHRVYADNRKRESMLIDICKELNPNNFCIKIMGAGWENIINELESMGYEVVYYSEFDKQIYNELIKSLDYYCYFGTDEGSMGYLDAVAAGVGTIVTPQGYHLDADVPITYPVETVDEILRVLHKLEEKRELVCKFQEKWTWKNYTAKHLEIWKYILRCEKLDVLLQNRGNYKDGIFSLLLEDLEYYYPFSQVVKDYINRK